MSLSLAQRKDLTYEKDGVHIYKSTILKIIPQGSYQDRQLKNQMNKIQNILEKENFVPDMILAHAENPQIYQLYYLKQKFPKAVTSIVFHGIEYLQRPNFKKWLNIYYPSINSYGFRSLSIYHKAKKEIGFHEKYFLCPSGIADKFSTDESVVKKNGIHRILFVGQLIIRKYADTIIHALSFIEEDLISIRTNGLIMRLN